MQKLKMVGVRQRKEQRVAQANEMHWSFRRPKAGRLRLTYIGDHLHIAILVLFSRSGEGSELLPPVIAASLVHVSH